MKRHLKVSLQSLKSYVHIKDNTQKILKNLKFVWRSAESVFRSTGRSPKLLLNYLSLCLQSWSRCREGRNICESLSSLRLKRLLQNPKPWYNDSNFTRPLLWELCIKHLFQIAQEILIQNFLLFFYFSAIPFSLCSIFSIHVWLK